MTSPRAGGSRARRRSAPAPRRRRGLLIAVAVVGILLIAGAYLGWQAMQARSAINRATDEAAQLRQQLRDQDGEQAARTLARLQDSTGSAADHTSGPLWSLATHVPFVGDDVSAVRTAASVVDDVATRALPPLVEQSDALDPAAFRPKDGRIDVKRLASVATAIREASTALTANDRRIRAVDRSGLVGPLQGPVEQLADEIGDATRLASVASDAAQVLPTMLGSNGTRRYALIIQNNAEIRPTGGIPGAVAILEARNGKVSLTEQYSSSDFSPFENPVIKPTKDESISLGYALTTDIRDTTLTPDFPRTGQIVRAILDRAQQQKVDGVISLDPVALSYALKGTGPVKVDDQTDLTADNAVELLLNTVYARFSDPAQQDAFFARAAQLVFDRMIAGQGDPTETLTQLRRAAREGRIKVWSANEKEEKVIGPTAVGGEMPRDPDNTDVGVYLSDLTSSKMQFYLESSTRVMADSCVDGRQTLTVTTTLHSKAPSDSALLPTYIVGKGTRAPLGSMQLRVYTFAPVGGTIDSFQVSGKDKPGNPMKLYGRVGARHLVTIGAGKTVTLTSTMTSGPGQDGTVRLSTTPGIASKRTPTDVASACS